MRRRDLKIDVCRTAGLGAVKVNPGIQFAIGFDIRILTQQFQKFQRYLGEVERYLGLPSIGHSRGIGLAMQLPISHEAFEVVAWVVADK